MKLSIDISLKDKSDAHTKAPTPPVTGEYRAEWGGRTPNPVRRKNPVLAGMLAALLPVVGAMYASVIFGLTLLFVAILGYVVLVAYPESYPLLRNFIAPALWWTGVIGSTVIVVKSNKTSDRQAPVTSKAAKTARTPVGLADAPVGKERPTSVKQRYSQMHAEAVRRGLLDS